MNSVQSKTLTFDRELIEERDYWVEKLSHAAGSASLRLDHDRTASEGSEISLIEINLTEALIAKLAKITGDSPFLVSAVLMATLKICLHKYTGSTTVTVGTPCRHRDDGPAPKPNALAMMDHVEGQMTVRELLMNVRATLVEGYARQNYPFARLVKDLGLETNRCPLFDVALVFENIHGPLPDTSNDITIRFVKSDSGTSGRVEYRSDLFNRDTIERLTTHWMNLLNAAADNVETRICDLQMLTAAERHQLLVEWNDTETAFASDSCVHELFEAQAARTPEALALVFDGQQLTYRELNERANQLARHLHTRGVGPETLVAVCMERCFELVIGVLGTLKAGGAYVPLDSANPGERLAFVLNDTHARVLLTKEGLLEKLPRCDAELVCLDRDWEIISREQCENLARTAMPENLAYVIYTSGSTGQPKGVMIKHQGVCNLAEAQSRAFGVRADSRVLQFAPSCFDASVSEIFMALTTGAALCLGNRNDLFYGSALAALLREQAITTVTLPPTALSTLTDDEFSGLETIIVAGESCPAAIATRWSMGRSFFNAYGPTEITVCASLMKCTAEYPDGPPIGYPMSNVQIYLLDSDLQPVPCGVPGELYVGGTGVGRGYLNRPELTAEKFIPNPFGEQVGARLYKTGDLAMYQPDGAIAFLGRIDHQVKLRGYRIELGEVEAVLARHPAVREAVVIARDDIRGLKRLIAYLVPAASAAASEPTPELSADGVKTFLGECLPDYMIPAAFVMLDELPLTISGKIDRRALPEPEQQDDEQSLGFVPPATAVEEMLAGIWSELLGKRQVGIYQSFFELGGHSLLATQILSRVREVFKVELPLFELFERPTVAQQAASVEALLRAGEQLDAPPIERVARNIDLPLSFAQQRLWFLDQLKPNSSFYNVPSAVRLRGTLDIAALEQSFRELIRRHEPLRTRFGLVDGVPLQLIDEPSDFELPVFDLRTVDEAEREAGARSLAAVESQRPFDLSSGPLLRASVVRLADGDHMLLCTMHHIISDGWSMGVLIRELTTLYEAYSTGRKSPLPELAIQYADFAHWQRAWLQGEVLEKQLSYWKKQLAGAPAVLDLPTDYSRPAVQTYSGATQFFVLPAVLREQLEDLSRTNSATLFMTLLAAFQTLLSRYSRQPDVVVGSPIANRNRAETESLIGFFVNTLVLRTDVSGDPSFRELLARVREVALGAYAHQDVPFELLVEELQPERSLAHTPLFQVVFTLQNAPMPRAELDKLSVAGLAVERATAKFDLGLNISGAPGELQGALEYNTDLFDPATIRRMLSHFEILLANVVSNPDQRLSELQLLTAAEVEHVVFAWNETAADYPHDKCIHQLFEEQVERTPEAVAVICADEQLTYRELDERANRLANYLQSVGAGPETIIGICLQRSVEMMVGLLGILKAGAAYVPVDPQHPAARVMSTLADARVRLLLTQRSLADRCKGVEILCLDEELPEMPVTNPPDTARADDLAYVIYTSGSTGQPKGVRISHRSAVNYLCWARDTYLREEVLNSALYSSLAFDLTVTSIYVPLISGGATIVFAEDEVGRALDQIVRDERVGLLKATPSHLMLLAAELRVGPGSRETGSVGVKRLVVGGEALSSQLARGIQDGLGPQVEIYNEYGPTEATVGCTIYRYQPAPAERPMVPIGRPAANVQIYILDERLKPVADYVEGEIYIGGVGVAEGYQGRAEQTAERFVSNPYRLGERMYRSGDMGRRLANGDVEFLGRRDQQVKVRGHRVELDELREKLNEHPDIRDSVVVITGQGPEAVLVAYYVSRQELEVGKLRVWLRDRVIEETIPNVFVRLKKMPLTVNGKINYAALPAPEHIRPKTAQSYVAPRTPTEEILAGIYADVLGLERVGVLDNFFEMGGHSLLATQVIARLRVSFQVELPLRHMFEQPTVAGLAAIVIETQAAQADSDEIAQILEELNQLSEDEAESLLQSK